MLDLFNLARVVLIHIIDYLVADESDLTNSIAAFFILVKETIGTELRNLCQIIHIVIVPSFVSLFANHQQVDNLRLKAIIGGLKCQIASD